MDILAHEPLRQASAMGEREVSGPVLVTPTAHAWLPRWVIEVSIVRSQVREIARGAHSAGVTPADCSEVRADMDAEGVTAWVALVPDVGPARHSTSARPRTRDRVELMG